MSDAASRAALARELGDRVGGDRRANTVLLQHVFGGAGAAAPGALLFRAFADHALFFDPRDDKIGSTLLTGREWQRPMVQRALALLREAGRAPEGKGLIDAGANIGATLTYLMRDGGFAHAHAFEPDPWNRDILTRNLDLNTLAASVTVCAEALGEAEGEVLLHRDARNLGRHSLLARAGAGDVPPVAVQVTTLDAYGDQSGVDPAAIGLVKIDVEGAELAVLQGMTALRAARVPLLVEVTGGADDRDQRARLLALIEGYAWVADVSADAPRPCAPAKFHPRGPQQDLLIY